MRLTGQIEMRFTGHLNANTQLVATVYENGDAGWFVRTARTADSTLF